MFSVIRNHLSLKISFILALVAVPVLVGGALVVVANETDAIELATLEKGKTAALIGAKTYGDILEEGIRNGAITFDSLAFPKYEKLETLDKEYPRFHSGFDKFTDRTVRGLQDSCKDSTSDFLYCVSNDINGYIPTAHTAFDHPFTGDPKVDRVRSRQKRMFRTAMHIIATENTKPYLVQSYLRDTGDQIWDISAPIMVRDVCPEQTTDNRVCTGSTMHYGVFRVGVVKNAIANHKAELIGQLAIIFGALAVVLIGGIFLMVHRATRPLSALTKAATKIAEGGHAEKLVSRTTDEVGQLTRAFNGMVGAVKVMMDRLGMRT